jgi:hypothetical protein
MARRGDAADTVRRRDRKSVAEMATVTSETPHLGCDSLPDATSNHVSKCIEEDYSKA